MFVDFSVLTKSSDIYRFVESCQKAADSERLALGFLPEVAYQQAAEQGKLFVAVSPSGDYLGHLMFGGVFPYVRVMQTYCCKESRHLGVGQALIKALVVWAEQRGCLSISARVAEDLDAANRFYERCGFQTVRSQKGGKVRKRTILTKVFDLNTPNLFDLMDDRRQVVGADFGIKPPLSSATPLYAIDLNVLFDFTKKRVREKEAREVLRAALRHEFQAALTDEFLKELLRTSENPNDDLMLELCSLFSIIPEPSDKVEIQKIRLLQKQLSSLVFPDRTRLGTITTQDLSDLRHLALCIFRNASGFITSEKAILRARDRLLSDYGLDVLSVTDFADNQYAEEFGGSEFYSHANPNVEISIVEGRQVSKELIESFFDNVLVNNTFRDSFKNGCLGIAGECCQVVICEESVAAIITWKVERRGRVAATARLVVDETSANAKGIADGVLGKLCEKLARNSCAAIELEILAGQPKTREVLLSLGFRPEDIAKTHSTVFHKIAYGKIVTRNSWQDFRADMIALAGIQFPKKIPRYVSADQLIELENTDGETKNISLSDVEKLLFPLILLLPEREGIIVPIRRSYADELLGTSDQLSLLGNHSASIHTSRAYYCKPTATIRPDCIVVFYESSAGKGRGAAVAVAKADQVRELTPAQIAVETNKIGVLTYSELEKIGKSSRKLTVNFTSIAKFNNLVSYDKLCQLGCNNGARFVTATNIGYLKLLSVISLGGLDGGNR